MSNADLLRAIFRSFKQNDEQTFNSAAMAIIAEEKRKNHNVLAQELLQILENGKLKPAASTRIHDFDKLPKDREKGTLLVDVRAPDKSLADIILSPELEEQVRTIVDEFHSAQILTTYGLSPRRKLLFAGPPGCGKTLCAEIIGAELGLPMLYTRFDAVISSYLGETAANLRKVFDYAQTGAWIVLFDEFDAIGKSRDDLSDHGELRRVVNTFLQLLDNHYAEGLVIAATNHETLLDKALWRRFDDILYFDLPNEEDVLKLITLKLRGYRHTDLDVSPFVLRMVGWSHADIEHVCFEAMKLAVLANMTSVNDEVFETALEHQAKRLDLIHRARHQRG